MKIKCNRPIITSTGMTEITFIFDTETLDLTFDPKDTELLLNLYQEKDVQDVPELTNYEIIE